MKNVFNNKILKRVGVYPGSFDPITYGHQDIIKRASYIVDHLVVAVAKNADKSQLFTLEDRVNMVRRDIEIIDIDSNAKVEVNSFDTLLMHYVEICDASVIIRGLRAVSDFEYEFQMAGMNVKMNPKVETLFLMASEQCQFISSRFVKEICNLGGDVSSFVSKFVQNELNKAFMKKTL
ncbi:MAG: pantetheine-phosphate adenylyltransferase [Rhodospirillaceae bacterium]|jgi:pantetheine-phosphate adenylyltransferase|nr:pantetheine-phosphate adenylyltransferase [Rhodospirillaceae bacterium]